MLSFFYVLVLVALPISAAAQERKVSAKLWEEVRSAGTVRISQSLFAISAERTISIVFSLSQRLVGGVIRRIWPARASVSR